MTALPCSLFDLDVRWIDREWDNRSRLGIEFRCPHCEARLPIFFTRPLDGGDLKGTLQMRWEVRGGSGLGDLTLFPSIEWAGHCHVHVLGGQVHQAC